MEFEGYTIKVMAVGDPGVGKNTLFHNSAIDISPPGIYDRKIGVYFFCKIIEINNENWKFQLWNFSDEEQHRFLLPQYCKGARGAFFIFDITNSSSFNNIYEWFKLINKDRKFSWPMILIGNKIDLEHKREIKYEQAEIACRKLGFSSYIECSFLTGERVDEIYEKMVKEILEKVSVSQ